MLWILRVMFIAACGYIGASLGRKVDEPYWYWGLICGCSVAFALIAIELGLTKRLVSFVSIVYFGFLIGFLLAVLFYRALLLIPAIEEGLEADTKSWVQFSLIVLFCYLGVMAIIQCRDEFKFVIPFIQLAKQTKGSKPWLLDTSVIIDGRIADLLENKLVDVPIFVPRFVLKELQSIADSGDRAKRMRGRRGLEMLSKLRSQPHLDVRVHEAELSHIKEVDARLVTLARSLDAKLVTNDSNLTKVAQLQGVDVLNMHRLADALKPVVLPGESLEVKIVKRGEEPGQGVGYLSDGTMVVVESAERRIGQRVAITVTGVIQTSAGRLIFGIQRSNPAGSRSHEQMGVFEERSDRKSG